MGHLTRMVTNWWARRRNEEQIAAMMPRDAADIGLAASELADIAAWPADVPDRMERMARVFSAEAGMRGLGRWRERDMATACAHCPHRRACAALLYRGGPAASAAECGFCPNAGAYREIAAQMAA